MVFWKYPFFFWCDRCLSVPPFGCISRRSARRSATERTRVSQLGTKLGWVFWWPAVEWTRSRRFPEDLPLPSRRGQPSRSESLLSEQLPTDPKIMITCQRIQRIFLNEQDHYEVLEKMNWAAVSKYHDMRQITGSVARSLRQLNEKCKC